MLSIRTDEEDGGKHIEVHFADEEADPYAVELAGRVEGYVTGKDSDFVVLNSEGYLGYIPLDEFVWIASDSEGSGATAGQADEGFQAVKSKKKVISEKATGFGIIPPDSGEISLSATLYTPASLAHLLNLPVSLLPLLGALVGNDYTLQAPNLSGSAGSNTKSFQSLLFERRLNLSQRIMHASATLGMSLRPTKRKQKAPQSVMELIQMTVGALLLASGAPTALIGESQKAMIVESIVEGTLPYAIPPRPAEDVILDEAVCALHLPDECRLVAQMDRTPDIGDESSYADEVSRLYLEAYRRGKFAPSLMDILSTRTFWPEIFLENPDVETVSRSVSRSVREFGYALLEEGMLLPASELELTEGGEEDAEEDPDEVIDVVEESDDDYEGSDYEDDDISANVGKLRGALRDLQFEESEQNTEAGSTVGDESSVAEGARSSVPSSSVRSPIPLTRISYVKKHVHTRRKCITEYSRRGTRVVPEELEVTPLRQFGLSSPPDEISTPIQLRSERERLGLLSSFLQTSSKDFQDLPSEERSSVLVLRLIIRRIHERAEEAGNTKEKQQERWTRREAQTFLASLSKAKNVDDAPNPSTLEEISERSIQLTAQLSTAIESIDHLAQILLLTKAVPSCAYRFSGQRFHNLLSSLSPTSEPSGSEDVESQIWLATTAGLDVCFADEKKGKKAKRKANKNDPATASSVNANGKARGKVSGSGSMYSLLADLGM